MFSVWIYSTGALSLNDLKLKTNYMSVSHILGEHNGSTTRSLPTKQEVSHHRFWKFPEMDL